jgi:Na+/proline symporter
LSAATAEKVVLMGLLSVIFAQLLPGRRSTDAELFVGVAVFVVVNAAVSLWFARGSRSVESALVSFGLRVVLNVGLVILAGWLLDRGDGELNRANALFFVLLLSLITLLDDRYRPVHDARLAGGPAAPTPARAERRRGPVIPQG